MVEQSNPFEMTGSWTPSGDDASGRRYTTQTYDWMGRPRVTTAPDGTTREASYGGCGCAGGAVVTLRGEEMMISGIARRRQQTITHDALGRAIRADEMNWDGTVYRTLRTTYNARDQVVEVRQEGASAAARVSTINYDGHGRVSSEQRPEQTQATSYLYNADDTVQRVTDARGATTNFLYNARHLVTQVSYTTPNATVIPNTPTVNYTYDAAGNRLSMTDGLGSVSYGYDSLSRLASETRQFTGVPRAHQLQYQYNLAGGLTRITDPDTAQVNYQHDRTGRVTGVTGAGAGSAPTYVSAIQYRAWGAARRVTYGNNLYADVEYNTRLQPTRFELGGANPQYGSTTVMRSLYSYYADGRIRFVDDDTQANSPFDRAYSFDQVGRTQAAYTGGEARNFNQNLTGGTTDGPYHHTYQHDEWDNMTSRTARYWSQWSYFAATMSARNQHPNWLYDAAGNLVRDDTRNYIWDAAGRNTRSAQIAQPAISLEQSFDGDGQRVKRVETWPYGLSTTNYYVRSSVLGGREMAEVDGQGNRQTGYVYMGGEVLATLRINGVSWVHRDPVTGSRRGSGVEGNPYGVVELDPEGVDVGQYDPFLYGEGGADKGVASFRFEDGSWMGDCTLDGVTINCAWGREMAEMGVAVVAPEQTTQWNYEAGRFEFFRAFGDGYSGFVPQGHGYLGQGMTAPLGHISRVGSDRLLHALLAEGGAQTLTLNHGQQQPASQPRVPGVFELINQRQQCERLLAALFGDDGAVMRTAYDVTGTYRGRNPEAVARLTAIHGPSARRTGSNSFSGNIIFDAEHLYNFPHLSGNLAGTENTEIYVPGNYQSHTRPTPGAGVVTFYYPQLGNQTNVTLAIQHVQNFAIRRSETNGMGSVRIGTTGGPGGDSGRLGGTYYGPNRHSHFELWRDNTGFLPPGVGRDSARMPFVSAFCP